MHKAIAYPKA